MRLLYIFISLIFALSLGAQNANQITRKMFNQFGQVKTYTNDVRFLFDIPNVNIKNLNGKEYFKAPDKYRVKLDGIAFVPMQNTTKIYSFLKDSNKYTALYNSTESIRGEKCFLVHIIPNEEGEMILGKIWISQRNFCPYKIVLTTKMGTVRMENSFGKMSKYSLPDKMIFYLENFKGQKLNHPLRAKRKEEKENEEKTGTIILTYSNYKINIPIADTMFHDSKKEIKKK